MASPVPLIGRGSAGSLVDLVQGGVSGKIYSSAFFGSGDYTLTASLLTNSNTFYTATISAGASDQTLTASLFTNGNTLYVPTVVRGTVTLTPTLYSNSNSFYTATVTATSPPIVVYVNVGGSWKTGTMSVNVSGTWKAGSPSVKMSDTWYPPSGAASIGTAAIGSTFIVG